MNARRAVAVGAAAVAALVAVLLVLAFDGGGDEAEAHQLSSNLTTALLERGPAGVAFAGTVHQSPGGDGLVLGHLQLRGDLTKGTPVPFRSTMTFRFEGGRIDATLKGEARPQPNKTVDLVGTGKIDGGTGEFAGARGSFRFVSGQEPANPTVGHPRIRGTIVY